MQLLILQKTYDMILYAYPALAQYPKAERHTLVADIKKAMGNMVRLITKANKGTGTHNKPPYRAAFILGVII